VTATAGIKHCSMRLADAFTDFHDTADTGRIMTVVVLIAMIALQAVRTLKTAEFNAQEFGQGCALVIAALGVYIWGSAKGQQITTPQETTTVTATKVTQ
jgi:hypothetical protein